jgi:uncharacterized membrane protein
MNPVTGTIIVGLALLVGLAIALWRPEATVSRATTGAGVVLIGWGQVFLVFGFIAGWRLLFAPHVGVPALPRVGSTPIADYAELVKALTAAPHWLSLTAVGSAQTVVGVLLLHLGKVTSPR